MKLIKDLGMEYPTSTSKKLRRYGLYECPVCLSETRTGSIEVVNGKIKMCMKCSLVKRQKHGGRNDALYYVWRGIKSRCLSESNPNYSNYGGRGISICEEWIDDYSAFKDWSVSNGYSKKLSIDRINNDGNYEPINCRWTTRDVQSQNTRRICSKNKSGYRGVHYCKHSRKWHASISLNGKKKALGSFDFPHTAALVRDGYVTINKLLHTLNFERIKAVQKSQSFNQKLLEEVY